MPFGEGRDASRKCSGLTKDKVVEIFLYKNKESSTSALAQAYGVSPSLRFCVVIHRASIAFRFDFLILMTALGVSKGHKRYLERENLVLPYLLPQWSQV